MSEEETDDYVRFNTRMKRRLRDDAKRKTERGELADEIRELFRRIAYGNDATKNNPQIDRLKAELRDARDHLDDLRSKRRRIDAQIEDEESRITRLEERIGSLEETNDKFESTVEALERVLLDGGRIVPSRIDDDLNAQAVIQELKDRNPDVPEYAFELAQNNANPDWRKVDR